MLLPSKSKSPSPLASRPGARSAAWLFEFTLLSLVLIANTLILRHLAFKIFKMFDMGAFLDYAWRIYCGQRPNIDFFTHVGPVYPGLIALFFKLFGPGMPAIFWLLATSHAAVILGTYFLVRKRLGWFFCGIGVLLTITGYYWCTAFPWYTHTAHLWPFLTVVALATHMPFQSAARVAGLFVFAGAASFVTLATKPNIALIYTADFLLVAAFLPKFRWHALLAFFSGILISLAIAAKTYLPDPIGFLEQTIFGFGASQSWRVLRIFKEPNQWYINHYWIVMLLVLSNVAVRKIHALPLVLLFLGVGFASFFETLTSGSVYQCNAPLMGLLLSLGFLIVSPHPHFPGSAAFIPKQQNSQSSLRARRIGLWGLSALGCVLIPIYAKFGLEVKQWHLPDRYSTTEGWEIDPSGVYPLRSAPFTGWMAAADQGPAFDEMTKAINRIVPENESPLILTDLLPLNMSTHRPGYIGAYVPYMIGTAPADGALRYRHHKQLITQPPKWIVTHDHLVAFITPIADYLKISDLLRYRYRPVFRSGVYILLKHTDSPETP